MKYKIAKQIKKTIAGLVFAAMMAGQLQLPVFAQASYEDVSLEMNQAEVTVTDLDETVDLENAQEMEIITDSEEEILDYDPAVFDSASPNGTEEAAEEETTEEYVVGSDPSSESSEEEEEEGEPLDRQALISALSNVTNDNTMFFGSLVLYKDKPAVKLQWTIKGAKSFTIDRFRKGGAYESIAVRITKKAFVDTKYLDDPSYLPLYRIKAYDAVGGEFGSYVTIPGSSILWSGRGQSEDNAMLAFTKVRGPFRYYVERDIDKKFEEIENHYNVYDPESVSENSVFKGYDILGQEGSAGGRKTLVLIDEDANIPDAKVSYYRVTSVLDIDGLDIFGKTSGLSAVRKAKFAAPTITRISRYAYGTETIAHDLCYDDGNIYVRFDNGLPSGIDRDEAEIVIYRAGKKGGYKKITSEYLSDMTTALDGDSKTNYVVPYDKFDPNTTYYYRAALNYKGVGAMSIPFERTCTFAPVEKIYCGEATYNSVKLSWKSDGCATKYNIYRSEDVWDSLDAAEANMDKLEKVHFKKIGTKKNDSFREGEKLIYIDKKGLELGMYHIYRIVPANKKEGDFYTQSEPMALKAFPASPEEVFESPININSMNIAWNKVSNATVYKIQRTDTAVGGVPVFEAEEGVEFKEWEVKAKSKQLVNDEGEEKPYCYMNQAVGDGDDSVVMGKPYYYRVVAAVNIGGAVMWADEESAQWTEAHTQLAPVRDMGAYLYSKSSVDSTNVAHISFKSSGKVKETNVDGAYDYERVDHYEISTATSILGLDSTSPMTINGKTFTYATTSETVSKSIIDDPDLELFKNVRGVKRGTVYYFAARPVYVNGSTTIKSKWKRIKFVMPVEVYIYPEGSNRKATNSSVNRYEIASASVKRFYLDFDPYDTTYTRVKVAISNTSFYVGYQTVGTSTFTSQSQTVFFEPKLDKDDRPYIEIKAPTVYSTATYIPTCDITVTAHYLSAKGDVTDQLVKKFYVKGKKESASSTTN